MAKYIGNYLYKYDMRPSARAEKYMCVIVIR